MANIHADLVVQHECKEIEKSVNDKKGSFLLKKFSTLTFNYLVHYSADWMRRTYDCNKVQHSDP